MILLTLGLGNIIQPIRHLERQFDKLEKCKSLKNLDQQSIVELILNQINPGQNRLAYAKNLIAIYLGALVLQQVYSFCTYQLVFLFFLLLHHKRDHLILLKS